MQITNNNGELNLVFYVENSIDSGIRKIADKVRLDIQRVTGAMPEYAENLNAIQGNIVIFANPDNSPTIRKLEMEKKIDLTNVRGKREVYSFSVMDTPIFELSGIKSAIVICGSDKRGLIYGLFHISELLGVSPLVDWADILPVKRQSVTFDSSMNIVTQEPSVRYRGFFINDEWPATGNWCNKRFGGFNAQMYEHVFELLLRMKGNYLWPAMWSGRFSDDGPGLANAELADELGVVMGASHHEPCCRAGEEYRYLRGKDSQYGDAWNFRTNKEGITRFWEDGLIRNGKFENVITVGMRGEADTAIMANATLKDNIKLLRDVIKTQNNLIKKYVNPDLEKVPRMLALYKEVEPYFYGDKHTKGLMGSKELDDVILMLCDDNHGNLRTVPTEKMRKHKGGYGMYYHFDYHGSPYSYEWINTSYLPKVKEQMCAAYEFGIRDLWIVNAGDIMTNEFPLNYFLDLAYDYQKYSSPEFSTQLYTKNWINAQFPALSDAQKNKIYEIITGYTKLAHLRRTECIQPDTYHPVNFNEGDEILKKAESIIEKAESLRNEIPEEYKTGYYAQVFYPACGNMNVLRMQLLSGKNKWFASKSAQAANPLAKQVRSCYEYDKALVSEYDQIADGKFYGEGWSEHFGFTNWCEAENSYPTYTLVESTRKKRLLVWVEGSEKTTSGQDWTDRILPMDCFKNPEVYESKIYAATCFEGGTPFEVSCTKPWLETTLDSDDSLHIQTVSVKIDRTKLNMDGDKKAEIHLKGNDGHGANFLVKVMVDAEVPLIDYPRGTFVQTGNYISIEAEHFTDSKDVLVLPEYGKTLGAVKSADVTGSYPKAKKAPFVEYKFVVAKEGVYSFDLFMNPSNPAYKDNKLQLIAEINGRKVLKDVVEEGFTVGDNKEPWSTDVTNNIRISSVYEYCKKGINKLRIYPVTPNIVLEKIVIHSPEYKMPESYLGAPETYRVK